MILKSARVRESCFRRSDLGSSVANERKCREIVESPSMMWKRSIVQATGGGQRRLAAALALALVSLAVSESPSMMWKRSIVQATGGGQRRLAAALALALASLAVSQSPSMMWKRSIVQATGGGQRWLAAALALALASLAWQAGGARGADLVIEIPGSGGGGAGEAGHYRLDYRPPHGSPAPNHTVPAQASTINFQGLPGTKYHFMLYYSNGTFADLLTWNQTIVTAPEPPTNLTVTLGRNKQATIAWAPPAHGDYTGFRFKVIALTERAEVAERNISVEAGAGSNWTHALRELSPGATYQLHAFTLLHDKESAAYASRNFTTKPNTPGKFIVWFRNETTLLVLWQPPYPPGFYTHYKVSIQPGDARDSELYVEKEGEPPGPAQAAFKGLVPGRAYNISVQTVSEPEISAPTTAQYRTVPLRPRNVTVPPQHLAETSFRVAWLPPLEESEFEKYQVSVSGEARRLAPVVRARDEPPHCGFDALEPGAHYAVSVKTMSGKVTSWPASAEVTLRPLPVVALRAARAGGGQALLARWQPAEGSHQDEFRLEYQEAGPGTEDSSALLTAATEVTLDALLPGRNYTVAVCAVSRGVPSNWSRVWAATRPLAPVLASAEPAPRALRLAWRSDVTSRQDHYRVRYARLLPPPAPPPTDADYRTITTRETSAVLEGLFPGAVYALQLAALSHSLLSDNHTVYKPTGPLPPAALRVSRATSNSALAEWAGPARDTALGQFLLRYRTEGQPAWTTLPPFEPIVTRAEIVNMTHGERYIIELDTLSEAAPGGARVPSGEPRRATHTVRPDPVSNVAQLVDTRNLTLEWPRGASRVDSYLLTWRPTDLEPEQTAEERSLTVEGGVGGAAAPVRVVLGGLQPGAGYAISIVARSYNLTGDLFTMTTRTRPLIQSEMNIVHEADAEPDAAEDADAEPDADAAADALPSILVRYTPTPASATRFDAYRFRLEAGEAGAPDAAGGARLAERAAAAEARRVLFADLEPGALYNLTMWTLSHNVTSHPVQRQVRLYPRPVAWLNASAVSARAVTLRWARARGVATDFEVQYLAARDTLRALTTPALHVTLHDLAPYTTYNFTVIVRAGTEGSLRTVSRAVSTRVRTAEAAPPAPRGFRPQDAAPARLDFVWDLPPAEANGELKRFVLRHWPLDRPDDVESVEFPPDARAGSVTGLAPGGTYEFVLRAETGGGVGEGARWTQHMAIAAPPRPAPQALPAPAAATPTTVAVRFRSDYFSAANGNVTAYTLVVAEDPAAGGVGGGAGSGGGRMPSWRDVQRLPVWPPYQVTDPYYPFRASPVEEFTIGSERCEAGARRYCNGPLKPATKYFVKLRAFTAPDKFTDTAYTVVHTEVDNTGWIIGVCVGAGVLAGGVGAALAVRRRRAGGAGAGVAGAGGAGGPGGGGPAPRTSRPVRVADFLEHYRLMSADSDFRFSEEFEELKHVGREQPTTAAELPVNRPKNRFTNILPYDHSRFKLRPVDDEEGSDYINANYVPGHGSPREFIVTQGPLHSTRDDFWRMCWESGARGVVMLTRCVEKGREKCDRYWPYDTRPVYYGDIAVTALNESRYPDWTITELMVSRGSEQRVVAHFHFTTWPDFGVPEPPETLARFVRAFRERCPPDSRPVVVHCSAGVGRSGTFITLDTALRQLAQGAETLDIFGMVVGMRRERVWMVQTEQQYICIHQCLVCVLEGRDLAPPAPPPHNHHLNPAFEDDEGIAESGM